MTSPPSNPSLWWRLSWQLGLVIIAVIGGVIVGLSVYATMVLSPNVAAEREITAAVAAAIARDDQGRLVLRETPQLKALKERNRQLWTVAATTDGASVSFGAIPAPFAGLAPLVHLFESADIRGAAGTDEIASVENVDTDLGEVRVLFGGFADKGWPVLAILAESYPIYGSLIAIALPAIFLTVPRIVRRALAKVSDVARKASQIAPRVHGARLPVSGIPKEVAPLVTAFNGTLGRLEAEFETRERFLIDAAHELRTPIAIMQTRVDGMSDGPERTRLLSDVARLASMAEQLLDFEHSDQTIDVGQSVDIVAVAREVVADLAPFAIAAGYEISFESEAERVARKGDPTALRRAVSNLVRNAIDHGGQRGMITVSASAGAAIEVADQGPGIAVEHRALVFEPFYRVKPKSEGAGLGLSLVKKIVERHGGQVIIRSNATGMRIAIQL
ncbi:sensor histidine kinase [Jiella pacifica]|uniref:Signal transduction histidine-protein kinase/phosphatase MprB n=1 Tax=Jiella pacifica TaxID=2696469 RepID=A0A6N9TE29_9HYPH|nr:HAMP domain-containing sensor histidine kinase [Jiella pacifica]NDW07929.1 sensor histidine kinase [Jiella pacifica]